MTQAFYPETLPDSTAQLVKLLTTHNSSFLADFYLSGGTALSLQLGHRESEDLDFFSQKDFDPRHLQSQLSPLGKLESLEVKEGTLNTYLNGVKLQFLHYPYKFIEPTVTWNTLALSSVLDIACTKIQTIGMRGSKKDFIDLHFLLQKYSLSELLDSLAKKYSDTDYNLPHLLKSLIYFADADAQPMPRMHQDLTWEDLKPILIEKVQGIKL